MSDVRFGENEIENSSLKKPLYIGAKLGFSKPVMISALIKTGLVKNESSATRLLLVLSLVFLLASFVIFWINAGGPNRLKKVHDDSSLPSSVRRALHNNVPDQP